MICAHCGAENADNAVFCLTCGKPVAKAPEHDTENPAWRVLKNAASSAPFLTGAITFTIGLVLSFLSILCLNALMPWLYSLTLQILPTLGERFDFNAGEAARMIEDAFVRIEPSVRTSSIGAAAGMIPGVLTAIGLWITFASAKKSPKPAKGGLVILQIVSVFMLVLICLAVLAMLAAAVLASVNMPAFMTSVEAAFEEFDLPAGLFPLLALVLEILLVIVLLEVVVFLIYQIAVVRSLAGVLQTIKTGKPTAKLSLFVGIMLCFCAFACFVSGNLLAGIADVAFAVVLFRARKAMRKLL